MSHAIYAQNLRRFPIVKLTDPLFLVSCGRFESQSFGSGVESCLAQRWGVKLCARVVGACLLGLDGVLYWVQDWQGVSVRSATYWYSRQDGNMQ